MFRVVVLDKNVMCEHAEDVINVIKAERRYTTATVARATEATPSSNDKVTVRPANRETALLAEAIKIAAKKDADDDTVTIAAMGHILERGEVPVRKLAKLVGRTHKGRGMYSVQEGITAYARQAGVRVNTVLNFRKTKEHGTMYIAGKNLGKVLTTALTLRTVSKKK